MKLKNLSLGILVLVFLGGVGFGGGIYFLASRQLMPGKTASIHSTTTTSVTTGSDTLFGWKFPLEDLKFPTTGSPSNLLAYSSFRDPGGTPKGLPVRLKVPVIGVDAAIEDAYITPDGRMDVPAGTVNVAWFALGPHPGQVGSAVIGGHYGIGYVFEKLNQVSVGAKIYIVDDNNNTLAFIVRRIQSFDRNGNSSTVFTSSDGIAHLNIITCEGIWNEVNGNYPQRLVLFTDAIPSEGAIAVNPVPVVAAKPVLPITAIAQATPTQAPTPTAETHLVITPSPIVTKDVVSTQQQKTQTGDSLVSAFVHNLYDTPLDGGISSVLIISILAMIIKIIL